MDLCNKKTCFTLRQQLIIHALLRDFRGKYRHIATNQV